MENEDGEENQGQFDDADMEQWMTVEILTLFQKIVFWTGLNSEHLQTTNQMDLCL